MTIDELKDELDELVESLGSMNKNARAEDLIGLLTDLEDLRNDVDSMSPDREAILRFLGWLDSGESGARVFRRDRMGYFWPAQECTFDSLVDAYLGGGA